MNRFQVIGNIGNDLEIKEHESHKYARLNVAVNEKFKQGNKKVERTNWFSIVAFNNLAEIIVKYAKKGQTVFVEGYIKNEKKDDKYYMNLIAEKVEFLS